MIKILGIIISLSLFISCSNEDMVIQDKINQDSTEVIENSDILNQKKIEEESLKQISHLEKIIKQNKDKLVEYELMISTGDTNDIKGLPQYVEDMKLAIKNKEERLKKLKKK